MADLPAGWALCDSAQLVDGGDGFRFEVQYFGAPQAAFAVRFEGQAHAYLNRCAHVPMELDWQPGKFFEDDRRYLMCATHGAIYEPASGVCTAGPCRGAKLIKLAVTEQDGQIYWHVPKQQVGSISPLFD
jgi:nitrite reductase/ring-hydroxylating ferredoxin subunit